MTTHLSQVRAVIGAAHLLWPGRMAGLLMREPLTPADRRVIQVLGARQLVQALATGAQPTVSVLALGVEVDAAHAASMVLVALCSDRWRRVALVDGLVALGFASAGATMALVGERSVAPAGQRPMTRPWSLKDRMAERLARRLVPSRLLQGCGLGEPRGGPHG